MCSNFIIDTVEGTEAAQIIEINERHQVQLVDEIRRLKACVESGTKNLAYALVGISALVLTTWGLFEKLIDQTVWLSVMAIVLSPFFGEAVRRALSIKNLPRNDC